MWIICKAFTRLYTSQIYVFPDDRQLKYIVCELYNTVTKQYVDKVEGNDLCNYKIIGKNWGYYYTITIEEFALAKILHSSSAPSVTSYPYSFPIECPKGDFSKTYLAPTKCNEMFNANTVMSYILKFIDNPNIVKINKTFISVFVPNPMMSGTALKHLYAVCESDIIKLLKFRLLR